MSPINRGHSLEIVSQLKMSYNLFQFKFKLKYVKEHCKYDTK